MAELERGVGENETFKKKLVRRRLKWTGLVEQMEGERLAKKVPST